MISHKKTVLSGIIFQVILISLSFLFNGVITHDAHLEVTFFREDTTLKLLGLFLTGLVWSQGNAYLHRIFASRLKIKSATKRGLLFGLIILLFIVLPQDTFVFIFIDFKAPIILAEIFHFTLTYLLGHMIIAQFHKE